MATLVDIDAEEDVIREAEESYAAQETEQLITNFAPCLPQGLIKQPGYNTKILQRVWANQFTSEEKESFRDEYGHLSDLLKVPFPDRMIRELINFWDPHFHCFTINEIDISPLAEEYQFMLRFRKDLLDKVYVHHPKATFDNSLSRILGMKKDKVRGKLRKIDKIDYLPLAFLLSLLENDLACDMKIRVFALILYGVVLYPSRPDFIGENAVKSFEKDIQGVNPIYSILSETFRALDDCYINGEGTLYGSSSLLITWFFGHLNPSPELGIPEVQYSKSRDPLSSSVKEFVEAKGKYEEATSSQWKEYFASFGRNELNWKAPWMVETNILYKCGNKFWVPLLGPKGCVAYAPSMFRRQMGCWQFIPPIRGMRGASFGYLDDVDYKAKLGEAVRAWGGPRRMDCSLSCLETSNIHDRVIQNDYHTWQQNRKTESQIFQDKGCKRKIGASGFRNDSVRFEVHAELQDNFERLRLDYLRMEGKMKAQGQELSLANSESKEMSEKIRDLENLGRKRDSTISRLENETYWLRAQVGELKQIVREHEEQNDLLNREMIKLRTGI